MSSKYKVIDHTTPHFLTFTVLHWIDVFTSYCYREVVMDSLRYCVVNKGLRIHAWVIMSNHIHLIASMEKGKSMSACVRDFKKFTARKIIIVIEDNLQESRKSWMIRAFARAGKYNNSNEVYQFWEQDYHPIELSNPEMLQQRMHYLHYNPVKMGVVWEPQHYKYSSAEDYMYDRQGLLPLVKLDALSAF